MNRIADIEIPDSKLATEATELVRDLTDDLIYHHSRRVFLFGSLQGRDLKYDPELLYVGAMFHDLGLTSAYRDSMQRFELDGADAAAAFLRDRGINEADAELVWTAIALHTTPEIPHHLRPEVALVTAGVEADVLGIALDRIPAAARAEIVAAHPRPDFKNRILEAFTRGIEHRPATTFGNVKADVLARYVPGFQPINFVDTILTSAWPE
ncbi:HD domain-containing protein [Kribbella voronezhensis]|uniref:HD domain-containing protein n=1 Tax=Kribbella voronezhensis TaxID=2512212 RepID=A0A4R7TG46_9ACTN|nr:HD domain-containing protein [Kribbella voronezhensis]TDU91174.1 HD domain-containing protein [Kribbella voronezhensis]